MSTQYFPLPSAGPSLDGLADYLVTTPAGMQVVRAPAGMVPFSGGFPTPPPAVNPNPGTGRRVPQDVSPLTLSPLTLPPVPIDALAGTPELAVFRDWVSAWLEAQANLYQPIGYGFSNRSITVNDSAKVVFTVNPGYFYATQILIGTNIDNSRLQFNIVEGGSSRRWFDNPFNIGMFVGESQGESRVYNLPFPFIGRPGNEYGIEYTDKTSSGTQLVDFCIMGVMVYTR